jgi:hypothetical protein
VGLPSTDIIEEVRYRPGAPAEYRNQGAVFNQITKSGSNNFMANANFYWQPDALTSTNVELENPDSGDVWGFHREQYRDFSAHIGGPIKKDKLWYFGGVQVRNDYFSEPGTNPEWPKMEKDWRYFAKTTWQVSPNNKINASLEWDAYEIPRTVTINSPYEVGGKEVGNNPVPNVNWTSLINDNTVLEVKYAGFYGVDKWKPNSGDFNTPGHYDTATGVYSVNSASWYDGNVWKSQVSAKASRYVADAMGSHDVRAGVQFIHGGSDYKDGYAGGMIYYDFNGKYDELIVQDAYHRDSVMRNLGFFVDDTWGISKRISLTLGLRYDHSVGSVPDDPQLDGVGNETVVTIENPGNVVTWNNIAAHGANFRFDESGKTVGRVHYGRFYGQLQTRIFRDLNRAVAPAATYALDPNTGARLSVISVTNPPIGIPEIQDDLKAPYRPVLDRLRPRADGHFSIGGSFVHKKNGDQIGRTRPMRTSRRSTGPTPTATARRAR